MKKFNTNYIYVAASFLAGLVIGGIVGGVVAKKVTEDKCDKEMDILRDIYLDGAEEKDEKRIINDEDVMYTPEEIAENERREALLKNWDKPVLKSFSEFEKDLAESEHPLDDDEDGSDNVYIEDEIKADDDAAEIHGYYEKHKNDPPVIISNEEAENISPGYEVREWTYFTEDDTMVDDDDQIVEDYRRFIGNLLDEHSDDEGINILSSEYMNLYKISKLYRKFSDMMDTYADISEAYL